MAADETSLPAHSRVFCARCDFGDMHPEQLSGGMKQRAAIARALVNDLEILLMDEPFGALDLLTRESMQRELAKIWGETGKTVLFVTHGIDEAIYLGDRVIVFSAHPGRIHKEVQIDIPRPRDPLSGELIEIKRQVSALLSRNTAAAAGSARGGAASEIDLANDVRPIKVGRGLS